MISMDEKAYQQHTQSDLPVLVEFWAPWCVYCRRLSPALSKVAQRFRGQVAVGTVNIDDEPRLAIQERIEVVPTLVLYQNGESLGSIVAPDSGARIEEFLRDHLDL